MMFILTAFLLGLLLLIPPRAKYIRLLGPLCTHTPVFVFFRNVRVWDAPTSYTVQYSQYSLNVESREQHNIERTFAKYQLFHKSQGISYAVACKLVYYPSPLLEFKKNLWGLGTDQQQGCRTSPPGYKGWRSRFLGIDFWTH